MKFRDYLIEKDDSYEEKIKRVNKELSKKSNKEIIQMLKDSPHNMDIYQHAVSRNLAKPGKKFKTSQKFRAGA